MLNTFFIFSQEFVFIGSPAIEMRKEWQLFQIFGWPKPT